MRISKKGFFAEVHSTDASQQDSRFRYFLYRLVDGEEVLLYESHRFHYIRNCVAKADEHLECLSSWENMNSRLLSWAA